MVIDGYLKSALQPTNSGIMNVSFWIITTVALVHLDTFINILGQENSKLWEINNLSYLSVYMLLSFCFLNVYRIMIAFLSFYIKDVLNKENDPYRTEGVSDYTMLCSSIKSNNTTAYSYYLSFKKEIEKESKIYQFTTYLFVVLSVNLLTKSSLYEVFVKIDRKIEGELYLIYLLVIVLIFFSSISAYYSVYNDRKINLYRIDSKAIENHRVLDNN